MKVTTTEIDVQYATPREKLQLIEALAASVQKGYPEAGSFRTAGENRIINSMTIVRNEATKALRDV